MYNKPEYTHTHIYSLNIIFPSGLTMLFTRVIGYLTTASTLGMRRCYIGLFKRLLKHRQLLLSLTASQTQKVSPYYFRHHALQTQDQGDLSWIRSESPFPEDQLSGYLKSPYKFPKERNNRQLYSAISIVPEISTGARANKAQ